VKRSLAGTEPKVFISHCSEDREFVEREVIALLRRHGIDTWYSQDDIVTAEKWHKKILEALKSSDALLVVVTPQALQSEWVGAEVRIAIDTNLTVVPVVVGDCRKEELDIRLVNRQHVDFTTPSPAAQARLLATWDIRWSVPSSDEPTSMRGWRRRPHGSTEAAKPKTRRRNSGASGWPPR
jgi:hypothetical protein